ncbi:MAG: transpeptidase family protein [Bacteroidales bacterium]|nr:transpeptidase family protein [Bacteroidales bacterium]
MKSKRGQIIFRYGLVSLIITALAFAIVWQAVSTTVVHADQWNQKADSVLNTVFFVQPKRGDILAADGTVLATNLTLYNICLDYRACARHDSLFAVTIDELSDSMAKYYHQRNKEEWRDYLAKPLAKKASERKRYHVLLKNSTYADYQRLLNFPFFKEYKKRYDHGLYANPQEMRMMPYGSMAKRSIGRCNYRRVAKFDGATMSKDSADVLRGYSGLEYVLDSLLYGQAGTAKYIALTRGVRSWVDQPAVDGFNLRTTIDINMQDIVENELVEMLQKTKAEWGTCLLMEVQTGDIKAISNLDRDKDGNYIEAMNYALQAFEPGSVMKPISMIVALEDNFAPLDRAFPIGSSYAYAGGSPIRDTHSPAYLPVSRFIEYSSNIGMTKLIAPHYENNLNGFRERLRELGFFDTLRTGMAGERPPYFPTLDPKAGGKVSLSRMSYGYSTMIPPLYTCAVYNAIANKGKFVRPRMVQEIIARDGSSSRTVPVSYVRDSICSQKNANILMDMLYSVVYGEGGTAKSLRNNIVHVVGKTGTCRIAYEAKRDSTGKKLPGQKIGYKEGQYRLAFCGVFPYENPKYTCMVLISNPSPEFRGAATTSGFVVKNVALKMFAHGMLDRHSDFNEGTNPGSNLPTIYACDQQTFDGVRAIAGVERSKHMKEPAKLQEGKVPDVLGLGMREALAKIEDAGYAIVAHGSGYAAKQTPPAGAPARAGDKITVTFSTR